MPYPTKGESEKDYISRFMESPEAMKDYPDEKQRLAVAYSMFKERKNTRGQSARPITFSYIEPGLVHYDEVGTVLVKKEVLDNLAPTLIGKPVFNENHKEVSRNDFDRGKADGVISKVWYDSNTGWFMADALVWDDETMANAKGGYSVSCAYDVPQDGWGPGGIHNNIPYDREVLKGEYTHLAIVNNPRYEGARIIYNQGGQMKLRFWKKEDKAPEAVASEVELANSIVEIDGKETKLEEVVASFKAELERKKALENSSRKFTFDDVVEVDGTKVSVKDLVANHKAHLKNASDESMKKDHKDGKHDEEDMKNCPMCNAKKEQKNAEDEEKAKKEKEEKEKMENSLKAKQEEEDRKQFEEVKNAANKRENSEFVEPKLSSLDERVSEGSKRYGA